MLNKYLKNTSLPKLTLLSWGLVFGAALLTVILQVLMQVAVLVAMLLTLAWLGIRIWCGVIKRFLVKKA